jgi:hypothetical protein
MEERIQGRKEGRKEGPNLCGIMGSLPSKPYAFTKNKEGRKDGKKEDGREERRKE